MTGPTANDDLVNCVAGAGPTRDDGSIMGMQLRSDWQRFP